MKKEEARAKAKGPEPEEIKAQAIVILWISYSLIQICMTWLYLDFENEVKIIFLYKDKNLKKVTVDSNL